MAFDKINIEEELSNFRNKDISQQALLEQIQELLDCEEKNKEIVLERLQNEDFSEENEFLLEKMETQRIFHVSHIRNICVNYRLRFLETKYFKGELPEEALSEIRYLEKQHHTTLHGFRIMAPSQLFKLQNADDPILFAPIGNDYYYKIHKWGQDLSWWRRIAMWPVKNFENLLVFSLISSFLLTFGIRELFFSRYQSTVQFILLFLFTFKSVIGLILFYGMAMGKNFSSGNWNSKFFN